MCFCVSDEELGDHFRDREGWQRVVNEGRAAGWLLRMQDVSYTSYQLYLLKADFKYLDSAAIASQIVQ